MSRRTIRIAWPLVVGFAAASAAHAQGVPSQCAAAKFKASAAYFEAVARCEAKASAKAASIDPNCLAKAEAKLAARFAKADGKGDCRTGSALEAAQALLGEARDELARTLDPTCCQIEFTQICYYLSDAQCAGQLGATRGARGTVCGPEGTCVAPPAAPGGCCEGANVLQGQTSCFSNADDTGCMPPGGTFVPNATCLPTLECAVP